jgi:Fur family ferric uptake transcriptional regulator
MQVQTEVQELVLVWIKDQRVLELVREFLEPLGYSVEFAPDAKAVATGQSDDQARNWIRRLAAIPPLGVSGNLCRATLLECEGNSMAVDSIKGSLREQGVRLTRQRELLLEVIDKSGEHLDAERLFQLAKQRDPKLNRVTVYRTLKLLKQGGLVDELDLMHYGGDQHYYETRIKQEHAHVICLRCGKVEEFFGEPLQRLRRQIESHFGFQILLARTEVGGYCSHCQSLRAREMEQAARESSSQQALMETNGLGPRSRSKRPAWWLQRPYPRSPGPHHWSLSIPMGIAPG